MPQICLYLQLHQPFRLREYSVFDIGNEQSYFGVLDKENPAAVSQDSQATNPTATGRAAPTAQKQQAKKAAEDNRKIFQKVAQKSYIPMLSLLLKMAKEQQEFRFALSCSGVFLEQAMAFEPVVIRLLKQLAATGQVEFLAETYYHSLAALYSPAEFKLQVAQHSQLIQQLFSQRPEVFRNTELIYSNDIAQQVADLGFKAMLTEAVDRYLWGRERTQVFCSTSRPPLFLLLKHAPLSDDIAFRFSDRNWPEYPLNAQRYLDWLHVYPEKHLVNLFMDFETFGEHQWEDTGIFSFFEQVVESFLSKSWNTFVTPGEVLATCRKQYPTAVAIRKALPEYDVPEPISWADIDRDLTAWIENELQQDSIRKLYAQEKKIRATGDAQLLDDWRKLQVSDHFYYMCTKWSADGDVHAYFSPYESPLEAYRRFSIVLADIEERLL